MPADSRGGGVAWRPILACRHYFAALRTSLGPRPIVPLRSIWRGRRPARPLSRTASRGLAAAARSRGAGPAVAGSAWLVSGVARPGLWLLPEVHLKWSASGRNHVGVRLALVSLTGPQLHNSPLRHRPTALPLGENAPTALTLEAGEAGPLAGRPVTTAIFGARLGGGSPSASPGSRRRGADCVREFSRMFPLFVTETPGLARS
jgi:hypothetical protein